MVVHSKQQAGSTPPHFPPATAALYQNHNGSHVGKNNAFVQLSQELSITLHLYVSKKYFEVLRSSMACRSSFKSRKVHFLCWSLPFYRPSTLNAQPVGPCQPLLVEITGLRPFPSPCLRLQKFTADFVNLSCNCKTPIPECNCK